MKGQCVTCNVEKDITEFDSVTIISSTKEVRGRCKECKSKRVRKLNTYAAVNGEKQCFKCGTVKPLNEYYRCDGMIDGYFTAMDDYREIIVAKCGDRF